MTARATTTVDDFHGQLMGELASASSTALAVVGDRLGLYVDLAENGPTTPEDLAARTNTNARYVREWLSAQAAAGWIEYDAASQRFSMNEAQRAVLADNSHPANVQGFAEVVASMFLDTAKVEQAFRTGEGIGWHEHHKCLFSGTERFFRPGYQLNLVEHWIPALTGIEEKLVAGGKIADVGCGHGASTILMAQRYPEAEVIGFDYHPESIERARAAAQAAGVADRVRFEIAAAKDFPGHGYDLICFFDCLHDMGDPVGAAAHVRRALAPNGSWMLVEPFANDALEDNLTLIGRIYYSASTMICTPASRSQDVGLALGAQAGEARLRDVVLEGGFATFRRAAETPTNLVLEARG